MIRRYIAYGGVLGNIEMPPFIISEKCALDAALRQQAVYRLSIARRISYMLRFNTADEAGSRDAIYD